MQQLSSFPWHDLIDWYKHSGREYLPWRDYTINPEDLVYRIWLSEIFLQQTQVDRVIGYFDRVIEQFPTISHLAQTDYEDFFPYYQGLGYYSRARNILKTARIIHEIYRGVFPREQSTLEKLPGVGPYTASALLAFGYGDPYLAWDTNLEKVFARYYNGKREKKLTKEEKKMIEQDFREYIDQYSLDSRSDQVRAINNALMDFAATVDLKNPDNINWENYPIQSGVFYESRGTLEERGEKKSKIFPIPDASVIVILHKDHHIYYTDPTLIQDIPEFSWQDLSLGKTVTELIDKSSYRPFVLPPALQRNTRQYVQEYFRSQYEIELSVRPVHAHWISSAGAPYIAVNAQIQLGDREQFEKYDKIFGK